MRNNNNHIQQHKDPCLAKHQNIRSTKSSYLLNTQNEIFEEAEKEALHRNYWMNTFQTTPEEN